jgi:hypothetical protein
MSPVESLEKLSAEQREHTFAVNSPSPRKNRHPATAAAAPTIE